MNKSFDKNEVEEIDVTVIIPIYNTEAYLYRCLQSVARGLGLLRYEVLMLDDGSTDKSAAIAKEFAATHDGFKYHLLAHAGQGVVRNKGLSLAKGKYVQFIDSDDYVTAGIIEELHRVAEREQAEVALCNVARWRGGKVAPSAIHIKAFSQLGVESNVTTLEESPSLVFAATVCNCLLLRSYLESNKLLYAEQTAYEDMLLALRIFVHATKIAFMRTRGYVWRIREDASSTTQVNDYTVLDNKLNVLRDIFAYAKQENLSHSIQKTLEQRFVAVDHLRITKGLSFCSEEEAKVLNKKIADLVHDYISPEVVNQASIIDQQIIHDVLEGDIEHIAQVIEYKDTLYGTAPVSRDASGKFIFELPGDIFTISNRFVDGDFAYSKGSSQIRDLAWDYYRLTIEGVFYLRRIELHKESDISIKAFLVNEESGRAIVLPIERMSSTYLTEERNDGYNYDAAGFRFVLDFETLGISDNLLGKNLIVLSFEHPVAKGYRVLRGAATAQRKKMNAFNCILDEYLSTLRYEADGTFAIIIDKQNKESRQENLLRLLKDQNNVLIGEKTQLVQKEKAAILQYEQAIATNKKLEDDLKKQQEKLKKVQADLKVIKKEKKTLSEELSYNKERLEKLYLSHSWRVGRIITYIPRKTRTFLKRKK